MKFYLIVIYYNLFSTPLMLAIKHGKETLISRLRYFGAKDNVELNETISQDKLDIVSSNLRLEETFSKLEKERGELNEKAERIMENNESLKNQVIEKQNRLHLRLHHIFELLNYVILLYLLLLVCNFVVTTQIYHK